MSRRSSDSENSGNHNFYCISFKYHSFKNLNNQLKSFFKHDVSSTSKSTFFFISSVNKNNILVVHKIFLIVMLEKNDTLIAIFIKSIPKLYLI